MDPHTLNLWSVVPFGGQPGGWQRLLSFLPEVIGAAVLVVAAAGLLWAVRRKWLTGRAGAAWTAGALAAGLLGLILYANWFAPEARRPTGSATTTSQPDGGPAWTTFMGGAARTGSIDGSPAPADGRTLWTFRDGLARAPFAATAAVADGRVFVGSDNGRLYCLDAATGALRWKFRAAHELFGSPAVAGGRVFLGEGLHQADDARLYCLDAASGEKLWEFPTTSHVEFSPTWRAGRLYFAAGEDGVYCIDAADGRLIWRFAGAHVDMSVAVADGGVFFGTVYGEPFFYRLDAADGREVWKTPAPLPVCGSPSSDGRRVYFGVGNGDFEMSHASPAGGVCCLDAADGRILWRTTGAGDAVLTSVALAGDQAFFGSRDGRLYCVDAAAGRERWRFDAGEPIVSSPAVGGGRVCFGCNDGQVYCLAASTGRRLWSCDTSAAAFNTDARVMASPVLSGGRLFVGSSNFLFFCLGTEPGRPAGAAANR